MGWDQDRIAKYKSLAEESMKKDKIPEEILKDFTIYRNRKVMNKSWWWTFFIGPFSLLTSLFSPEFGIMILSNKRLILIETNFVMQILKIDSYQLSKVKYIESKNSILDFFSFTFGIKLQLDDDVWDISLFKGNYKKSSENVINVLSLNSQIS